MLNVLIACEESQRVCIEMRKLGHHAFSCDIEPARFTDHPEWHINDDVLKYLNPRQISSSFYGIAFPTQDGEAYAIRGGWDLIIAHPPCTYLTVTGNRWFDREKFGWRAEERERERENAADFFMKFVNADCKRIAIENPVGCMSTLYRKPDQIIQPYFFGDPYRKTTCLWLKNLPPLAPTEMVEPEIYYYTAATGKKKSDSQWRNKVNKWNRSEVRSETFPGIARAMAEQWTAYIENGEQEEKQISLFEKEDT